jgi:hypothetical protein
MSAADEEIPMLRIPEQAASCRVGRARTIVTLSSFSMMKTFLREPAAPAG